MELRYSIFGESHGPAIGVIIENLPAGIVIDTDFILAELNRRRAKKGGLTTSRIEADLPEILSGVFEGKTTGTPLCAMIRNENTRSEDYSRTKDLMRPSHADFTGFVRYAGHQDYRGGGHFSARLTAPLVFAGAIAKLCLREKGIETGAHILQVGAERDTAFDPVSVSPDLFRSVAAKDFAVIDDSAGERMKAVIQDARMNETSVGGIIQCAVTGIPAGIGSPDRDSLEGIIARNIFAVPAIKGIEFGLGFGFAQSYGHQVNDQMAVRDGKVVTLTNHNGGILGGISNGMPVIFQAVCKPTPSISRPQKTVDIAKMGDAVIEIHGRHDPCVLTRAAVIVEAAAALAVLEAMG
ncbi:MAG: chorismate synthase [Oscillospiraceae bacterium]|nr:chorismate synthase [Oscillospiraceae bacterium]